MAENTPKWSEWTDLSAVVYNVELIVADAPAFKELDGLFSGLFAKVPAVPPGSSALYVALHRSTPMTKVGDATRIAKVLPGIELLGPDRPARVRALIGRLVEMPAYRWIVAQQGYGSALAMLPKIARQIAARKTAVNAIAALLLQSASHLKDTREFLLLDVLLLPLMTFSVYHSLKGAKDLHGRQIPGDPSVPPFPTKAEVESAARLARRLKAFLNDRYPISELVNYPSSLAEDLGRLEAGLAALAPGYKRPKVDAQFNHRRFMDDVIRGCLRVFNHCSPTLVGHLLSLVDYTPDDSDLKKRIGRLKVE